MVKIFFYPHSYFRDRHLETIRQWPKDEAINPEIANNRQGTQVSATNAILRGPRKTWRQILPLMNIKNRPAQAPADATIYCWGGIIARGPYIIDLDNPWALTGYNLFAMRLYKPLLKLFLLSSRCVEIRCMSAACRESLRLLFGQTIYQKAVVHYPLLPAISVPSDMTTTRPVRFLFIGTQFQIKGGVALIRAFATAQRQVPDIHLDVITHLPSTYHDLVKTIPNLHVHPARFTRDQIYDQFMRHADVLVLPTYVESFGMVALEAMAHGLAVIATDVYALRELVQNDVNGYIIPPPISCWNGYMPSALQYNLDKATDLIEKIDTFAFESALADAMLNLATNPEKRISFRRASLTLSQSIQNSLVHSHEAA